MRGKPECLGLRVLSCGHHRPGARADWEALRCWRKKDLQSAGSSAEVGHKACSFLFEAKQACACHTRGEMGWLPG